MDSWMGKVPYLYRILGTSALFNFPYGIATMSAGRVLVADSDNHAIRLITLNHHLSPQATGITTGKIYDQNVDPKVKGNNNNNNNNIYIYI